jgi:type III restriction enzyme
MPCSMASQVAGNPNSATGPAGRALLLIQSYRHSIPFPSGPLRKRILIALSIDNIVQHVIEQVHQENAERLEPVFDLELPIGSTRIMRTWYSTKPCLETTKSQINHAVVDSTWKHYTAQILEKRADVAAYGKNDHLGFLLHYLWRGSRRKFVPDFLIRLTNGKHLVLEIKGEDSDQNRAKRLALDAWVRAVNSRGGFGTWCWDVVKGEPSKVDDGVGYHSKVATHTEPIGEGILLAPTLDQPRLAIPVGAVIRML